MEPSALPVLGLFGYAAVRLQPALNEALAAINSLKFLGPGIDLLYADLELFRKDGAGRPGDDGGVLRLRTELRMEGVHFRYPEAGGETLAEVDLTIRAGESVGIVGPTGGGKSTLVDLMLGLLEPTRGRVTVDGVDIRDVRPAWHRTIGMVSQTIFLTDDTLRRNIALGVADARSTRRPWPRPSSSPSSTPWSRRCRRGSRRSSVSAASGGSAPRSGGV